MIALLGSFFASQTQAVQYDSGNSSVWCSSSLQTALNSSDYTSLFGTELSYIATDNDCTGAYFSLISQADWNLYKENYKTGTGGSTYLPTGVTNAWTNSPNGANAVYYINSAGSAASSIAANSNTGYEALPTLRLSSTVCVEDGSLQGNIANPFTLTTVGCNTAPAIAITTAPATTVVTTATNLTISGTTTDNDSNQTITISATIGGVLKSTTIGTTPVTNSAWTLSWTLAEMTEGSYSNIVFTASDGIGSTTATYTGTITVDKTAPTCGAWDPTAAATPWHSSGGQTFTLAGSTDAGGSNINVAGGDCTTPATDGATCDITISDNAGNTTTCTSPTNKLDATSPVVSCTITPGAETAYQHVSGATIYYNPAQTGSFTVGASMTPPPSGVSKVTFPLMTATGWLPSAATDDTASPYSQVYTWNTAATTSPGAKNIVATYGNGLTQQCTVTVTADSTAPTLSINYVNQFVNSTTNPQINVNIPLPTGSGSGLDLTTRKLYRAEADLSGGVCGTYSAYTETTWTGTEPDIIANAPIAASKCYKYEARVSDNVGNVAIATSSNEVKVDTAQPVVTVNSITHSSSDLYYNTGTNTLYYKTPSASTNFTVNASANDPVSGIASVTFPGISATGFSPAADTTQPGSGPTFSQAYTLDGTATTSPGNLTVTATNNAALTTTQQFTVTADNAGPTGNSVTCPTGGYSNQATFNVTGEPGTDAISGLNADTSYFQVASTTLTNGTCGTYSSFSNTGTAGDTTLVQQPMAEGCYQYRYYSVDMVGNVTASSTCEVKVDLTAPTCGAWNPAAPVPWKSTAVTQAFTLESSVDSGSGMAAASYNCTAAATNNATCNATIADLAGNTTVCTSPENRIDLVDPTLNVTAPESGWQSAAQDIIITANDTTSGVTRIAYSWSTDNLGADCSGGTTITSGTNLKNLQPEGSHALYVCTVNNASRVTTYTGTYMWATPPTEEVVELPQNVPSQDLYWNIQELPEDQAVVVGGYLPQTSQVKDYQIILYIPETGKTYTQNVTTTVGSNTNFEISMPVADFNPTPSKYTFAGPQVLTIKDLTTGLEATIDYNVTFYFPVFNTTHQANQGLFIFAGNSGVNIIE